MRDAAPSASAGADAPGRMTPSTVCRGARCRAVEQLQAARLPCSVLGEKSDCCCRCLSVEAGATTIFFLARSCCYCHFLVLACFENGVTATLNFADLFVIFLSAEFYWVLAISPIEDFNLKIQEMEFFIC
jgi:hypothetical protein